MSTRYINTGTVSDEHGKGVEMLRIAGMQVVGAASDINVAMPVMVAEVDGIIRHVSAASVLTPGAGTAQVQVAGTNVGNAVTLPTTANGTAREEQTGVTFRKGQLISVNLAGTTSASNNLLVEVGWMPDLWSQSADNKTYTLAS